MVCGYGYVEAEPAGAAVTAGIGREGCESGTPLGAARDSSPARSASPAAGGGAITAVASTLATLIGGIWLGDSRDSAKAEASVLAASAGHSHSSSRQSSPSFDRHAHPVLLPTVLLPTTPHAAGGVPRGVSAPPLALARDVRQSFSPAPGEEGSARGAPAMTADGSGRGRELRQRSLPLQLSPPLPPSHERMVSPSCAATRARELHELDPELSLPLSAMRPSSRGVSPPLTFPSSIPGV